MRKPKIDYVGKRYGRMTVTSYTPSYRDSSGKLKRAKVTCLCSCGTEKVVYLCNLKSGSTVSCGCAQKENGKRQVSLIQPKAWESNAIRLTTHGLSKHYLYSTWTNMMRRCHNSEDLAFPNYGGRGVFVCQEWHDPKAFLAYVDSELGIRPVDGTLDRKDNNGSYEPGNLRWATPQEQVENRRGHCPTCTCQVNP